MSCKTFLSAIHAKLLLESIFEFNFFTQAVTKIFSGFMVHDWILCELKVAFTLRDL